MAVQVDDGEGTSCVVVDIGSGYSKVGFAGGEVPEVKFETILESTSRGTLVGPNVEQKGGKNYNFPVSRGIIINSSDIECLLDFSLESMETDSTQNSLLVSEPPLFSPTMRDKFTEIAFETFNVPSFYLFNQNSAALYSVGRMTGTVVDLGAGTTTALPISSGYCCSHALQQYEFGGIDLTRDLLTAIKSSNQSKANLVDYFTSEKIKESLGFVAASSEESEKFSGEEEFKLPDGSSLKIGKERMMIYEKYMKGKKSLAEAVCESIATSDEEYGVRQTCFQNILLTGGVAKSKGLKERFMSDIKEFAPTEFEVEVIETGIQNDVIDPINNTWVGGSLLALLENTKQKFITKAEFDENGLDIAAQKLSLFET